MKICVCGGGNLGHVVTGFLAARRVHEVRLLTRKPHLWSHQLKVTTPDSARLVGHVDVVSSEPEATVAGADMVILCLPGFSIHDELLRIRDYLSPQTIVGSIVSSTGFFFEAMKLLPDVALFGFQRVPFIARTVEYGHQAALLGYKSSLSVSIERTDRKDYYREVIERLFQTPTQLMDNFYEVSLTNSNPLLHTARLYSMWKDWDETVVYPQQSHFYAGWTVADSELLMTMDEEFFRLLGRLPVRPGTIPTVLDYYESHDAGSLTRKLRSIPAFQGLLSPMRAVGGGFVPDFSSRYFMEDFPYGLAIVKRLAEEHQVKVPVIDMVCDWGLSMIGR